jgi:Fe-S oxidoreductase
MFGPDLVQAMRELKEIFDPGGKMNPGKIVDPYPIIDGMKLWPNRANDVALGDTHFRYPDDGGSLARATLRCVGVGKCRRESGGEGAHDVMCPSYMVTREERHSTRGRAHLLFEMLRADGPIADGWRDDGVKEALDLCLACKGCKSDCPLGVDVAKYKAEFFAHYWEGRRRPRHAYAFGLVDVWLRLAELAPGLANFTTQLPGLRVLAKLAAGVSQHASLPALAPVTFRRTFARRAPRVGSTSTRRKVVLFADTFNDHFHPDTLMAGVDVLEAAGYEVVLPRRRVCCGRPLYDFGMVGRARGYLEELLDVLAPEIDAGVPVVFLEPSCASVLKDELHDLMPEREDAAKLRARTMMIGELLIKDGTLASLLPVPPARRQRAIVQGHCHHKAVLDFRADHEALGRTGLDVEVLSAGCCGMAGAFGFVEGTRAVGHAAGERDLLPRIRRERIDTLVVANGFSCREQIAQHSDRRALHLAEVLKMALDGTAPTPGEPPERAIVEARARAVRRSMMKTTATLGAVLLSAIAARRLYHASAR